MKFTNSSFYTQHVSIVTCTLVVLSFGVILVGILNETHEQGLSAEASLRRRLPASSNSLIIVGAESAARADFAALEQKEQSLKQQMEELKREKLEKEKQLQTEDDNLRKSNPTEWNERNDETFFKEDDSFFKKHSKAAKGLAICSGVVVAGVWALYSHYTGMEAGGMESGFDVPAAGCGFGILTTVAFIYILFVIASNHGGRITRVFGKTLANSSIYVSSGCLLFGGTSISTLSVCPEIAYVCGALSAGAFFLVLTFWALGHFDIKSGSKEHKGALVVSACMVIGFGLLFFGADGTRDAAVEQLTQPNYTCMDISGVILGIAFGTLILWFAVRQTIQSCRQ